MNILILMDPWESANSPIERSCKQNIIQFISSITDNWLIYYWDTDLPIDYEISAILELKSNATHSNNAVEVYDLRPNATYFFAGFHANHCLFYNCIGIDKLLEFHPKAKFFVLNDLTCGLNLHNDMPVCIEDIVASNNLQRYRKQMLLQHMIHSSTIIDRSPN
tara:strand:- start:837 stop:1325 length:489 start_codon:yes stop_codon:yes gene_type:complete